MKAANYGLPDVSSLLLPLFSFLEVPFHSAPGQLSSSQYLWLNFGVCTSAGFIYCRRDIKVARGHESAKMAILAALCD